MKAGSNEKNKRLSCSIHRLYPSTPIFFKYVYRNNLLFFKYWIIFYYINFFLFCPILIFLIFIPSYRNPIYDFLNDFYNKKCIADDFNHENA